MRTKSSLLCLVAALTAALLLVAPAGADCTQGQDPAYCTGPVVTTTAATNVTDTGATLNGTVNPRGKQTTYHFEIGTTTSYGTNVPASDATVGNQSTEQTVSQVASGLAPNTTYHYRLVATDADGQKGIGADQTFTTTNTGSSGPVVATGEARDVTATSATLTGAIIPGSKPVQYAFGYGTTTQYGSATPLRSAPAGQQGIAVSDTATGLQPGTTYHFTLVAVNSDGQSATGGDKTFTTVSVTTGKVRPRSVTHRVRPKRDTRAPYRYRVTGRVKPPASASRAGAGAAQDSVCSGKVRIRIKQGRKTRGKGTARVRSDCRYAKRVRARAKGTRGKLKVKVRYLGNAQLKQRSARTRTVYFGPRR